MKKVLVILPNGNGGAERQSIRIASYLPKETFSVKFVVIGSGIDRVKDLFPDGAEFIEIHVAHIWQGGIGKLWRCFRRECPYAVFSSFHYLNGRCILAAMLAGISRRIIRGNNSFKGDGDPLGRVLVRLFARHASAFICQTDELRAEAITYLNVPAERAFTLYNTPDKKMLDALAATAVNPYRGDGPHFVNLARITKQKGQDVLLRAFLVVKRHIPKASLYLVGGEDVTDRTYLPSLKNFVQAHQLEDSVSFVGYQGNPVPWVKFADCLVLSSRWEGLPNALIEAQYLGVPSVATECIPSMSRIISEGINGHIVPPEDPVALAVAMLKALDLKDVPYTYQAASPDDFVKCFD